MRIELKNCVITQLTDGRYKAVCADNFAILCTFDLDEALAFCNKVSA